MEGSIYLHLRQCGICHYMHTPSKYAIRWTNQTKINGHRQDIRQQALTKPVGEHFSTEGHMPGHQRILVLRHVKGATRLDQEVEEQKLISAFDCIKKGLNRDLGFLTHYTY